jgi:CheY-like chemotaxis protein
MPTLLIVDDHSVFRTMARAALSGAFQLLGEASDGAEALALSQELRPEVVLLDVHLPDADGFAVATALAAQDHRPVVVLTSSRDPGDFGSLVEESAARGFIEKERLSADALIELLG